MTKALSQLRILFLLLFLSQSTLSSAMIFTPPSPEEIDRAIGAIKGLPVTMQRAFIPEDAFESIPVPKTGDWLAEHFEPGQTFGDFRRMALTRPDREHSKVYLQPMGAFVEGQSPPLEKLALFAASYFMMDVKILPLLSVEGPRITARRNPYTQKRQLLTLDILTMLKKRKPLDAFCVLGITMEDLFPDPSWNFVFGQASPKDGIGVFSFARYDSAFYGEKRTGNYEHVLLRRSLKVLAHEVGHMFYLAHCIYFRCVMNGSNHLKESDARPMFLCPVCLRKLHFSIGFDVIDRYRKLLDFCKRVDFENEVRWLSKRLKWIREE